VQQLVKGKGRGEQNVKVEQAKEKKWGGEKRKEKKGKKQINK